MILGELVEEIPRCRKLFKSLTKHLDCQLIEKSFCKHCSPKTTKPRLLLKVKYADADRWHQTALQDISDLKMLLAFFQDNNTYRNEFDAEIPLREHLPRLKKLLGIREDRG